MAKKMIKCVICGKMFESSFSRSKYCSYDCKLAGSKKRYKESPSSADWFSIREFILERDDYKCVECGKDYDLQVHHIVFLHNGGGNSPDNLVTLCAKCHAKAHLIDI